ncbi:PQQ-binding-like beta-propeller repeat protein [Streptomyces sp. NBC_00237]|uniref:serine/threonine-protein kinase n=1 Tax=Streptomyces sp. NBC_00237 TaxID=2975687 RepID=UPI00225BA63C|nr:serine/threonine-protein kinase [Streptomyces sp. NBC_00237]MCX5200677.1 PQQ-binding-like beta-propeller repeat protein [Streptomyces sp. NBC_00237]
MSVIAPLTHDDPEEIGGHTLVGRLGSGGMGTVYLARTRGGRTVALKTVHEELAREPQFRTRFHLEAEAARSIGAAHGAQVVDCDPAGARPWLATEYLLGPSLDDALQLLQAPLPEATVRAIGAHLASSLEVIHRSGIVHRDLKPSNIILTASGPRIIDFGIARALGANRLTSTGQAVGTPQFMSPEQAGGSEHDGPGDVFALGSVLVCAATGWPPFGTGSAAEILYQIRYGDPQFATALAEGLHAVLLSCLVKDPAARPRPADLATRLRAGSTAAFGDVLPDPVLAEIGRRTSEVWTVRTSRTPAPPPSAPVTVADSPSPGPSRRRLFALGGAALGAAALGTGWYAYARSDDPKRPAASTGPRKRPPGTPPTPLWSRAHGVDSLFRNMPVQAGGALAYLDTNAYRMTTLDARTGNPLWERESFSVVARVGGGKDGKGERLLATLHPDDVLAGSEPGPLTSLDPRKGTAKVLGPLGRPSLDPVHLLTATDDALYLADSRLKTIAAYATADGRELWRTRSTVAPHVPDLDPDSDPTPPAHFSGGRLAILRGASVDLYAADTGRLLQRVATGNEPEDHTPPSAADTERVYLTGQKGLVAVDAARGTVVWRKETPGPGRWTHWGSPEVANGTVYLIAHSPERSPTTGRNRLRLFTFDARTGAPSWGCDVSSEVDYLLARPVVRGERVYLTGTNTVALHAVDTRTHKVAWTYAVPSDDTDVHRRLTADTTTLYLHDKTTTTAFPLDPA